MPRKIVWCSRTQYLLRIVNDAQQISGYNLALKKTAAPPVQGDVYWASPTGAATWAAAKSQTPLSGTACCSLSTANSSISPGNTVYLRAGTYGTPIQPPVDGLANQRIVYSAYGAETPVITNLSTTTRYAIRLIDRSYISIYGIYSLDSLMFFYIGSGACYNEIANCVFDRSSYLYSVGIICNLTTGGAAGLGSDHNWLHHNVFSRYGEVTVGGSDQGTVRINAGSSDPTKNNTFEYNVFFYGGHDNVDIGGQFNVSRHNVYHNEQVYYPWLPMTQANGAGINSTTLIVDDATNSNLTVGSSLAIGAVSNIRVIQAVDVPNKTIMLTTPATWADNDLVRHCYRNHVAIPYFGNRCQLMTNYGDVLGTAYHNLIESNRIGHSGCPPDDDGAMGVENAGCHTIIRFNDIYDIAGSGIYYKGQPAPQAIMLVTGDAATDILTTRDPATGNPIAHSLTEGRRVYLNNIVGGANIVAKHYYYVKYLTTTTFSLSTALGGETFDFATDITSADLIKRFLKSGSWSPSYNNSLYHIGYGDPAIGTSFRYGIQVIGYYDHAYMPWPEKTAFKNNIIYDWYSGERSLPDHSEYVYENNYNLDPHYVNANITDHMSLVLPDLSLRADSPCIRNGIHLTLAVGAGNNSTALVVDYSWYFQDGWGSALAAHEADWIAIGTVGNIVQIQSINYETHTITLKTPMTWVTNAPVWIYRISDGTRVLYGNAPEQGAHPYTS